MTRRILLTDGECPPAPLWRGQALPGGRAAPRLAALICEPTQISRSQTRCCQLRERPRPLGMSQPVSQPGPGRREAGQVWLSAGQEGDKRLRGPMLTSTGFSPHGAQPRGIPAKRFQAGRGCQPWGWHSIQPLCTHAGRHVLGHTHTGTHLSARSHGDTRGERQPRAHTHRCDLSASWGSRIKVPASPILFRFQGTPKGPQCPAPSTLLLKGG